MTQDTSTEAVERVAAWLERDVSTIDVAALLRALAAQLAEARQWVFTYSVESAARPVAFGNAFTFVDLCQDEPLFTVHGNGKITCHPTLAPEYTAENAWDYFLLLMGTHNQAVDKAEKLQGERDTLAKQAEDCARTCAEQAGEIQTLTGQLAEARNAALDEAVTWHRARALQIQTQIDADDTPITGDMWGARAAGHSADADYIEGLKTEPAPLPKSKVVPSTAAFEVCGICDIAGCHHTRELNEKMPNEIAAWPTFPDGCVTGSWSANQHHQDAVAYVRKEPATRQSVQEAARVLLNEESGMSDELNSAGWEFIDAWRDNVQEPLSPMAFNHCKPMLRRVFNHYLRALAQET